MYLKQGDTDFQDQRNYSHNTAKSPRTHLSCTSENCLLNSKKIWPPLDETAGQFVSSKCWHNNSTQHNTFFNGTPPSNPEQRVDEHTEQRVNDHSNQITIPDVQRVSNAPPTMTANNPTSKIVLQAGKRTHQCTTRRNPLSKLPLILHPGTAPSPTPFHVPHIIEEVSTSTKVHKVIQRRAEKHKKRFHNQHTTAIYSPHQRQTPHPIAKQPHHKPDDDEYVPPRGPQQQPNTIYSYKTTITTRPTYEPRTLRNANGPSCDRGDDIKR